uniref:V-SNARE coiled-coil homology domain-containing protein n=1 Tax=Pseudictyota dubia TaxID=2749911 RepID=A0A7R9ZB20_9STRA|mmetsp:Transcript_38366/g.70870  ORF Transcript_38366/g.70870 Transcript_38366/m.70870 type:complete len:124 (+) Transcript_38366:164-535(+)
MMNPADKVDIEVDLEEATFTDIEWDEQEPQRRHGDARVASVQSKVDSVKSQMHENIVLALENTAKTEELHEASLELVDEAAIFREQSRRTRRAMMMRNMKWAAILLLVVGILAAAGFGIFHHG